MEAWQLERRPLGLAGPLRVNSDRSRTEIAPGGAPAGTSYRPPRRSAAGSAPETSPGQQTPASPLVEGPRLLLHADGRQFSFGAAHDSEFLIGRSADCHLVLSGPLASRQHVRISFRRKFFVLVDESSNGTWWRSEDGQSRFIHRKSVRLWGAGELSFGEPLSNQTAVQFQIQDH